MCSYAQISRFSVGKVACLCLCCLLVQPGWSQTNSPATPPDTALEKAILDWQSHLGKLEQIQEQQETALKAIERGQQEMALALSQSMDTTVARLNALSDSLAAQRERDLEFIRESNQFILRVVSGLGGLLFLSILFMALASSRAMNRLSDVVLASPLVQAPPQPQALADEPLDPRLLKGRTAKSRELQLQSVVKRLETRVAELENIASQKRSQGNKANENRAAKEQSLPPATEAHPTRATPSPRVALTVGEGAAIGFLPSDAEETGEHPKPKLFGRWRKLLFSTAPPPENSGSQK